MEAPEGTAARKRPNSFYLKCYFNVRFHDELTFSGVDIDLYGRISTGVKDLMLSQITVKVMRNNKRIYLTGMYFCDGHGR